MKRRLLPVGLQTVRKVRQRDSCGYPETYKDEVLGPEPPGLERRAHRCGVASIHYDRCARHDCLSPLSERSWTRSAHARQSTMK